ncbi:Ig-like domain-containing protein [Arsukibacterium sp.]|uniref:Ig-like domain-containing protein n=1 Tax=Arsukibacterium sp. TaxID=1977258 RepID=UPI002FD97677
MQNIRQLLVALLLMTLAACGGGGTMDGGGGDGGGTITPVFSLTLQLTQQSGVASTNLSQATPLTLTATLSATNNGSVANRLITFNLSDAGLASFNNAAGTALTNAEGVAIIGILVGTKSGAGEITATFAPAGADAGSVSRAIGFSSAGDGGDQVDVTIGSLTLLANKLQLGSGATDKVELYAIVKDTRNVLLAGVPVAFSTSPAGALGGELEIVNAVTAADGIASAVLKSQINPAVRSIVVNAQVGDRSEQLTVNVVGTSIDISAPGALVVGASRTVSILLRDFDGNALANQPLSISSALGNSLSATSLQTNSVGQAEVTYTATNSGVDTVSVSGLGLTQVATVNVSADEFSFVDSEVSQEVMLNTPSAVTVRWSKDGVAQANQPVSFVVTRGIVFADEATPIAGQTDVMVNTDADGEATVFVQSASAGLVTISASAGEEEDLIGAQLLLEYVANSVAAVEVQASPSQLGVNEQSSVRAVVRDANNNPVKNKTVSFVLSGSAGGTLNPASGITNSQGIASTIYTATAATGANEVLITANVDGQSGSTTLSVGQRTLFFRFGTGNTVEVPSSTIFRKAFSVIVTDASGNPVANQVLNVAVTPVNPQDTAAPEANEWAYSKGIWVMVPNPEEFEFWAPQESVRCQNEDANLNGVLDPGEDFNNDGSLTPGNVVSVPQQVTTDSSGVAEFKLTYPADFAAWTHVNISVSAFASGTENRSSRKYVLSYPSSYVTVKAATPARNPFGASANCADTF